MSTVESYMEVQFERLLANAETEHHATRLAYLAAELKTFLPWLESVKAKRGHLSAPKRELLDRLEERLTEALTTIEGMLDEDHR